MPAPFAHPTKCTRFPAILNEVAAVFGRVSVVQIASENSANDRADGGLIHLTHDFLALMLGARDESLIASIVGSDEYLARL